MIEQLSLCLSTVNSRKQRHGVKTKTPWHKNNLSPLFIPGDKGEKHYKINLVRKLKAKILCNLILARIRTK